MTSLVALLGAGALLVWPSRHDPAGRLRALGTAVGATTGGPDEPAGQRRRVCPVRAWFRRRGLGRTGSSGPDGIDGELLTLIEGLAATLRAGLTPVQALSHLAASADPSIDSGPVANSDDLVSRLAGTAVQGARLEPVWRAAAERSGHAELLAVAQGWALSERHGAPVVDVLDALVTALRDRARTTAAVETALAAPRATAALLGVLPLFGVALGQLIGAHPVAVLAGTPLGRVVGVLGLAATVGGRLWMRRLVTSVAR